MASFIETVLSTLTRIDARAVIDILIVAAIVYWILNLIQGTTAVALVRGMITLILVGAILGSVFDLVVLNWLIRNSLPVLLISIPILFQPELRRALERLGRTSGWFARGDVNSNETLRAIEQISLACRRLADRRWGALIVLERETALGEYIDTGIELDGLVSSEFVLSIFFPNAPLHDGAAIIRGNRVVAAGCLLPLTDNVLADHQLGTRHRAGVGITERTDAICVIVSEETGIISLANNGRIVRNLDEAKLNKVLPSLYYPTHTAPWLPSWFSRLFPSPLSQRRSSQKGGTADQPREPVRADQPRDALKAEQRKETVK
jgi:diadenylate cyclase